MTLLDTSFYQKAEFWFLIAICAVLYIMAIFSAYNSLVKNDYHNWVLYGRLNNEEAKSVGLLFSILWPIYWMVVLVYAIIRWILKSIIGLIKMLRRLCYSQK